MKRNVLWVLLLLLFSSAVFICNAVADDLKEIADVDIRLSQTIRLTDLLNYAYETNPMISESTASWKIAIETFREGTAYPDPVLMATYFPRPIETRLGPQDWNMTLSQGIPFPGKLTQKGKVLEADAGISKLQVDKTVRGITTTIAASYYELTYIQQALVLANTNCALAGELLKIGENGYADDRANFYDVAKAQSQLAQIQYDILLLEELEQTEKTILNTLLNRAPDAALGRAEELALKAMDFTLADLYALFLDHQEDILMADRRIEKSRAMVKLAGYENLPSFKVGLFYAAIGHPDVKSPPANAGDDAFGIQFGLDLPLWFGKNQARKAKALAAQSKAESEKQVTANKIRAEISRLWFKLGNSRRLITLYESELIPQASRSVKTAEIWYRQGQGSFSDFIELMSAAYNFQLSRARAMADYGKAFVMLEQLVGISLGSMPEKGDTPK